MSKYVITITPDTTGTANVAHTTVRVDTSSGQTRITELTVRAGEGGGLAPADLPAVDLDMLVRALASPAAQTAALPERAVGLEQPAGDADVTGAAPAPSVGLPAPEPAHAATIRPKRARAAAKKTTRRGAAAAKTAGGNSASGKTSRQTGKRAAGRKAAAASAGTRATAAPKGGARAYRRMPDAAEVLAAYAQTGTITGLAEHFAVPRHTVAGWARRLRQQGHAIGRQ